MVSDPDYLLTFLLYATFLHIAPPKSPISAERLDVLVNGRSEIEGIIGHLKHRFQMGR